MVEIEVKRLNSKVGPSIIREIELEGNQLCSEIINWETPSTDFK